MASRPDRPTTAVEPGYGWLPAVIPAGTRRFRTADAALLTILQGAGLEPAASGPDLEIGPVERLGGDARVAVGLLGRPARGEGRLLARAVGRLVSSLQVHLQVLRARRMLRRLGYAATWTLRWDHGMVAASTARGTPLRARLVRRLPQRALVVGASSRDLRTLVDEIVSDVCRETGRDLEGQPSIRAELLIIETEHGVLRVGTGPACRQLRRQRAALSALQAAELPDLVAVRVPRRLAVGSSGIAEWTLESRLEGTRARPPLSAAVLADCVDFLVALHGVGDAVGDATSLAEQAEVLAIARGDRAASHALGALSASLEDTLSGVPRGFAHGDFFHGNLLVDGGHLAGVVDWDAAGAGRLPFLDLFHLRLLSSGVEVADLDWGPSLVRDLLPWARHGGDDRTLDYARRIGVTAAEPALLEALVLAYWLDYASYQIRTHEHRLWQPRWIERNVTGVLRTIEGT